MVSPDGLLILCSKLDGTYLTQRVSGEAAQTVPGLTVDDEVIRWSADNRSLYVYRPASVPWKVERLDVASGGRVLVHEVFPADRTGALWAFQAGLTDDHTLLMIGFERITSQLFVVEGAR